MKVCLQLQPEFCQENLQSTNHCLIHYCILLFCNCAHSCAIYLHRLLPTCDIISINFYSSIRNLVSINILLPTEPWMWGLPCICFPRPRGCAIQAVVTLSAHWFQVTVTGFWLYLITRRKANPWGHPCNLGQPMPGVDRRRRLDRREVCCQFKLMFQKFHFISHPRYF